MKKVLQKVLKFLSSRIINKYNPDIIGITGSVGKTSTKEAVFCVLNSQYNVRKNIKNYNNEIGLPLTIIGTETGGSNLLKWLIIFLKALKLILITDENYPKILVLEMGVDRPGDMKYLIKIAPPKIGVLTAVGESHALYFKDQSEIKKEKEKLLTAIKQEGTVIFNYDEENLRDIKDKVWAKVISYGFSDGAELKASDLKYTGLETSFCDPQKTFDCQIWGITFKVNYLGSSVPVFLRYSLGKGAVYAALAAISLGLSYKMNLVEIADALNSFEGPKGRLKFISGIKDTVIIDDTYNSAPKSAKIALELLAELPKKEKGRKIAVLGDMLELGESSKQYHREIGFSIAENEIDYLITLGNESTEIAKGALEAGLGMNNIKIFAGKEDLEKCGIFLQTLLQEGDIVLVKGSQGMRMEKIVKEVMSEPLKAKDLLVRQYGNWLDT